MNELKDENWLFINHLTSDLVPISLANPQQLDHLRLAAVLMPLFFEEGVWKLLFIHRSEMGEFHRGEVAFPGGAKEIEDQSIADTAKRETHEELGISPDQISILGSLWPIQTISNYFVTPIVGVLNWPLIIKQNKEEVARVFSIPLDWLMDDSNWRIREFDILGKGKINTIVYNLFDGEQLWGFSAKITQTLIQLIKKRER